MSALATAIPLRVGARTLVRLPRRLRRVALSLDEAIARTVPALPPLGGTDGYWLTSLADDAPLPAGFVRHVRQRYDRHYADLTMGHARWLAQLSSGTRSSLGRKTRRLAAAGDGTLDIRRYHRAADWPAFYAPARAVSARTYQERLLDAGLPEKSDEVGELVRQAGEDRLRAWLLFLHGEPIAYLCCTAEGSALRYDFVGHDPAHGALSPGTVLHAEAMRDLYEEARFARFDFTEGDGQHKRAFATGAVACIDVLLLRPTAANIATAAILGGWDRGIALGKRLARAGPLASLARLARR